MSTESALLSTGDYLLARFAERTRPIFEMLGQIESQAMARRISGIAIDRPVFVTGLARGGTTMLIKFLAQADGVATARYRDFPFLFTPIVWNHFVEHFAAPKTQRERPHRDGILIDGDSPDAFEEPIWRHFWPENDPRSPAPMIGGGVRHADFETYYRRHLQKILWLRKGQRYAAKGNDHVVRIEYLARLFPDARFIVPLRHPVAHVGSLVRQHALFTEYAARDPRIGRYLEAAGHFEFGPQRRPLAITPEGWQRATDLWRDGEEAAGYAAQWAEIYRYLSDLAARPDFAGRILFVRHEDLCARPKQTLDGILDFTELEMAGDRRLGFADEIASPAPRQTADSGNVWPMTETVAAAFGYGPRALHAQH